MCIRDSRHKKFMQTLEDNDIPVADYTMITDVVKDGDRVVGAVGFHVPSGTVITFNAVSYTHLSRTMRSWAAL